MRGAHLETSERHDPDTSQCRGQKAARDAACACIHDGSLLPCHPAARRRDQGGHHAQGQDVTHASQAVHQLRAADYTRLPLFGLWAGREHTAAQPDLRRLTMAAPSTTGALRASAHGRAVVSWRWGGARRASHVRPDVGSHRAAVRWGSGVRSGKRARALSVVELGERTGGGTHRVSQIPYYPWRGLKGAGQVRNLHPDGVR